MTSSFERRGWVTLKNDAISPASLNDSLNYIIFLKSPHCDILEFLGAGNERDPNVCSQSQITVFFSP